MSDAEPLLTRAQSAEFLTEHGRPITKGTLDQYASKGVGPPVAKIWGKRPLYSPPVLLNWAESRTREPGGVAE